MNRQRFYGGLRLALWVLVSLVFCALAAPLAFMTLLCGMLSTVTSAPYYWALRRLAKEQALIVATRPTTLSQQQAAKLLDDIMGVPQFQPHDVVRYVPYHAYGDTTRPDCQNGFVTSISATGTVFVLFKGATPEGCYPDQLRLVHRPPSA